MAVSRERQLSGLLDEIIPRVFSERPADFDPWFFDYFAEQSEPEGRARYARALLADLDLAGVDPCGRTVVDAGSGFGLQLIGLASLGASPAIGLEAFAPMAATATRLASRYAPRLPVVIVRGSVSRMPIGRASADLVYCNEALSHFIDPPGFLAECARVLKPGGRLMVCDGNNAANRRTVSRVHAIWKAFEEGPVAANVFGHRVDRTYRERRRQIISQALSGQEAVVLDRLAWGTFGLSGGAVLERAREMLETGRLPEGPPAVDRCPVDPVKGDHIENLIHPKNLAADLERLGFSVRVHAHFGGARSDWIRAANRMLRAFTPLTLPYARSLKLVATRDRSGSRPAV
jgi:ubiquinone/menaquinone biosynthesis C-methylase UbiE